MPVLLTMYPIAISLIFLTFLHSVFKGKTEVYQGSLLFAFIISLFDGLKAAGIKIEVVNRIFTQILPMYNIGLGWLIPAIAGGICGYILSIFRTKQVDQSTAISLRSAGSPPSVDTSTVTIGCSAPVQPKISIFPLSPEICR